MVGTYRSTIRSWPAPRRPVSAGQTARVSQVAPPNTYLVRPRSRRAALVGFIRVRERRRSSRPVRGVQQPGLALPACSPPRRACRASDELDPSQPLDARAAALRVLNLGGARPKNYLDPALLATAPLLASRVTVVSAKMIVSGYWRGPTGPARRHSAPGQADSRRSRGVTHENAASLWPCACFPFSAQVPIDRVPRGMPRVENSIGESSSRYRILPHQPHVLRLHGYSWQ